MNGAVNGLSSLQRLLRYTAWADSRLYDALAVQPAGLLAAPRPGSRSLLHTLAHMQRIDLVWQAHLSGRPHGFDSRQVEAPPPLDELRRGQQALDAWYIAHADALDAAALQQVLAFEFIGGEPGTMRREDILLHVVNHKTYHRGYIAEMLYAAGTRPPVMDLPVFLRDAAGAAG